MSKVAQHSGSPCLTRLQTNNVDAPRTSTKWLESGALKPNIGEDLSFSEVATAHQLQEDNTLHAARDLHGKTVLTP
ncbi:MAG: hypothetical protein M2R45_03976 [Verrucomicrobia subdivision 3 bacterium]|nr:hypothetical protein [Limisphaerales bacterium]MCS1415504.1 hypothetical protein [Limisphaerales bacterium]